MAKANINSKKGFTIIEVVLVLAIAGLIFLMVFIALPALQRSQRDTQRRNDISRVQTALLQYQTNHSTSVNNLPTGPSSFKGVTDTGAIKEDFSGANACQASQLACTFVRDYMNSGTAEENKRNAFRDPGGNPYSVVITANYAKSDISGGIGQSTLEATTDPDSSQAGYTIGGESPFSEHVIYIIPGARCQNSIAAKSEIRHFAILYRLEGSGVYCLDDQ